MDRGRDRRYDRDRYPGGGGESYRPSEPRDYRPTRSPPRGLGLAAADTYTPGGRAGRPRSRSPRRRSRTPPGGYRTGRDGGNWGGRPRSPPRRFGGDTYRAADTRARSPGRDGRYREKSRDGGSPYLKRSREASPAGSRGRRSPPPAKRERFASPRRDDRTKSPRRGYSPRRSPARETYRRRSRSPRRDDDSYRRRSPSPRGERSEYPSGATSGQDSAPTSRRSSPPVHPSRLRQVPLEETPASGRSPREIPHRPRSPRRDYSPMRTDSPPRRSETTSAAPPTGPRGDFNRAPPSGPSSSRNFPAPANAPPTGPSGNSVSMSAHARSAGAAALLAAPSRPRGRGEEAPRGGYRGGYGGGEPHRDFSSPAPRRGSSYGYGGYGGRGGPPPPSRSSFSGPSSGYNPPSAPGYRGSSNSTSTTYPRTQRFDNASTPSTSGKPQTPTGPSRYLPDPQSEIIPGGKRLPDAVDMTKINKLEEEAKKLREIIEKKQQKKREGLREWERLERESTSAGLRSELAEESLRALNGESQSGAAY